MGKTNKRKNKESVKCMNGNRYMEVNDTNDTDVNDKRKKSWYDKRCEKKDRKINHRETGEEI